MKLKWVLSFAKKSHSNECDKTEANKKCISFDCFQISQPHAEKHVVDDDDPIVDNNEIDTNNNLDSEWAISISRTYRSTELRKWRNAPVVQNVYGRPGEMGEFD